MEAGVQVGEPLVGLVETKTSPPSPPYPVLATTHNDVDGQEIRPEVEPPVVLCQAAPPPVGLVEVKMSPELSTAAQNDVDAHETPVIVVEPSILTSDHEAAFVGLVEIKMSPCIPTPTHNEVTGQERSFNTQ